MIVLWVILIKPMRAPKQAPTRGPYIIEAIMTGICTMVGLIGTGNILKIIELNILMTIMTAKKIAIVAI